MACSAPRLRDHKWVRAGKRRVLHVAVRRRVDRSRKGSSAPRKSSGESQPEALPGQCNPLLSGLLHRKRKISSWIPTCSLQWMLGGPGLEPVCLFSPSAKQQVVRVLAREGFLGYVKVSQGICFLVQV